LIKITILADNFQNKDISKKIMKKFIQNPRILFPFFMALTMAFIMSGVLIFINLGLVNNFIFIWIKSFIIAFAVAFPTAFFITPIVQKIVKKVMAL